MVGNTAVISTDGGIYRSNDFFATDNFSVRMNGIHAADYWGFGQGFDLYHDPLTSSAAMRDWRDERRAEDVIDDVLVLMRDERMAMFLIFLKTVIRYV